MELAEAKESQVRTKAEIETDYLTALELVAEIDFHLTRRTYPYRNSAGQLVAEIDRHLTRSIRHYRTLDGHLLTTLDQVVNAILADNLLVPEALPLAA